MMRFLAQRDRLHGDYIAVDNMYILGIKLMIWKFNVCYLKRNGTNFDKFKLGGLHE